jgi:hypothetical protein
MASFSVSSFSEYSSGHDHAGQGGTVILHEYQLPPVVRTMRRVLEPLCTASPPLRRRPEIGQGGLDGREGGVGLSIKNFRYI